MPATEERCSAFVTCYARSSTTHLYGINDKYVIND